MNNQTGIIKKNDIRNIIELFAISQRNINDKVASLRLLLVIIILMTVYEKGIDELSTSKPGTQPVLMKEGEKIYLDSYSKDEHIGATEFMIPSR
ncbi:hypothetical protein BDE36_3569 [Arcticibacter tournemirensis]|uniref:hypothetical protein n=2 Tax=Arcticibacter tournemirensis TaxID=699437 RepID=UPI0011673EAF|nr:hypothetical protein [Arcticibacter tournemirensis]TQM51780.1 hypothetical protein BDE36_3569 [Arcticibacter tournemirensis]